MSNLFNKYVVSKADGSPVDPSARYFVLRYDTDPHAWAALRAYAVSVAGDDPELGQALLTALAEHEDDELAEKHRAAAAMRKTQLLASQPETERARRNREEFERSCAEARKAAESGAVEMPQSDAERVRMLLEGG
jgi:hypothetical protein